MPFFVHLLNFLRQLGWAVLEAIWFSSSVFTFYISSPKILKASCVHFIKWWMKWRKMIKKQWKMTIFVCPIFICDMVITWYPTLIWVMKTCTDWVRGAMYFCQHQNTHDQKGDENEKQEFNLHWYIVSSTMAFFRLLFKVCHILNFCYWHWLLHHQC